MSDYKLGLYIAGTIAAVAISYGSWVVGKHISYKYMYEDKVIHTCDSLYGARLDEVEKLLKLNANSTKVKPENKMIKLLNESNLTGKKRVNKQIREIFEKSNIMSNAIENAIVENNYSDLKLWLDTYKRMFKGYWNDYSALLDEAKYSEAESNEIFGAEMVKNFEVQVFETLDVLEAFERSINP